MLFQDRACSGGRKYVASVPLCVSGEQPACASRFPVLLCEQHGLSSPRGCPAVLRTTSVRLRGVNATVSDTYNSADLDPSSCNKRLGLSTVSNF